MFKLILKLFVYLNLITLFAEQCLSESLNHCIVSNECQCITTVDIICNSSSQVLSLNEIFKNVSQHSLSSFTLIDNELTTLSSNFFENVSFKEFFIHHNKNLTTIEENAFMGSEISATLIYLHSCAIKGDSIFKAISKLSNLIEINLDDNQIEQIPDFAFGEQYSLKSVALSANKIQSIGQMAFFSLITVNFINLENNQIEIIEPNVFSIQKQNKTILSKLTIDLRLNQIREIMEFAFKALEMPINLDISFNNITQLHKNSFENILIHDSTKIIAKGNPLECDCKVKWIYEDISYKAKFSGPIRCADKTYFQDLNQYHFENCTSF